MMHHSALAVNYIRATHASSKGYVAVSGNRDIAQIPQQAFC
jgi:hypothetical protein